MRPNTILPKRRRSLFMLTAVIAAVGMAATAALYSSSSTSSGSSPEGVWVGTMTQPGGPFEQYLLRVEIRIEGTKITGKSRIEVPGTEWYGEMPIEGELAGDTIRYTEGWMVAKQIPSEFAWCLKQALLRFRPATDTLAVDSLIGSWSAPSCLPGEIRLGRVAGASMTYDTTSSEGRFLRPDSIRKE